jgi:UDP-glucuronate decarboxylase
MPTKPVIKKTPLSPTVLIAGGAGFIGSHLAEALLLKDARVIVLDNFKTGKDFWVGHLLANPKFALYDVDINSALPPEIESVDYIFHLAGVEEYLYSDNAVNLDALLTNAVGTKALLDLADRSKAKFMLASSIYVYQGMMSQIHLNEYFGRTNIEEKKYSLTEAKRYAEALAWEYYKKNDTDVRIVRLPEIYGPKMDLEASGNLGRLVMELAEDKDLTVYGEGTEKEYYLYINDAISGIIKSLFNEKTKGKIFSLISPEPYSVLEVSYLLKSLANREIKIHYKPKPREIPPRSVVPDTSNLKDLKWEIKTSFKDGVIKTLNWFGYETNDHSFKPSKLIHLKSKEKALHKDDLVTSLEGEVSTEEVKETPPPPSPEPPPPEESKETISSMAGLVEAKKTDEPKAPFKILSRHKARSSGERGSFAKYVLVLIPAIALALGLYFLGIPLLQTYASASKGASELGEVPMLLSQFDSETSQMKAESAFQNFYRAQVSFNRAGWFYSLIGQQDQHNSLIKVLSSATYSSKSAYYFSKASTPLSSLWETIRPTSSGVFNEDEFEKAKADFTIARNNLQLAEAEFKHVDIEKVSPRFRPAVEEYKERLVSTSSGMDLFSSALLGVSDLIGVNTPKKYLILFQNSNEIRPTGGFIGSYAILEMEEGKIAGLTIDDIYNPDGQIDQRGIEAAPPEPIAQFLEEDVLYIRNANWDPDFPQSSRVIEDLYHQITGVRVDGVIAIDLNFAQKMLEVTGPIFLTAYSEEISSTNLYERSQFHSEFNYEDGSDQKRSFLTVLGGKLLEKIFAVPQEDMPMFLQQVYSSLNERHLLVYLPNNPLGAVLKENKWDGSLVVRDEGDYLQVVNANLGGTKANYFVENDMVYQVSSQTRDGLLRGVLTLTYKHTGENSAWPGGPYTNYVRVLTQDGSVLTGALLKFEEEEEQDIFEEIVIAKVGPYNSYETYFTLEPQESVQLIFSYDLPESISITKDSTEYVLYWQKQPGTYKDTYSFDFEPPFGMETEDGSILGTLNKDKEIYVILKPR